MKLIRRKSLIPVFSTPEKESPEEKIERLETSLRVIRTWAAFAGEKFEELGKEWQRSNLLKIRDKCIREVGERTVLK